MARDRRVEPDACWRKRCVPLAMHRPGSTGPRASMNLVCPGSPPSRPWRFGERAALGSSDAARDASKAGVVPNNVKERMTTEYPANGSSSLDMQPRSRGLWREEYMVKPHGSLVPVSFTHRCASTPGLSTWSSTRSLQEPYGSGDLISWRVSRLDAFRVSPFRT